ncbi:MAG: DinB family protein [Bacteroidetes bacterium]|nr:DinB family protein [Bacteroidota bacterium]
METVIDQNQLLVKMALDAWNAQVNHTSKLLSSLSDEQLQNEVAPGRNRGIYLVGHLAAVNDKMLPLLNFGAQKFPQWSEAFLNKADRELEVLPTIAEIRNFWSDSCAELSKHFASLTANDWFERHTSVSAEDFVKEPHRNKLNVVIGRTGHLAYHLGQLNFLKK